MRIKKISLNELKYIIKRIVIENETQYDMVGKYVGDVFGDINGVKPIKDKIITYVKLFKNDDDDFSAISKAEKFLKNEGYDKGSMYMNYPIPFMYKGKTGIDDSGTTIITTKWGEERPLVITKYDRLGQENWDEMDGVLLSSSFRNDDVYVVFFNFPD